MRWVCFSYIYMPNTTKYQDNGYYVIYDCFNKAAKDCKTKDIWLGAFDLYKNYFRNQRSVTLLPLTFLNIEKRENVKTYFAFPVSRF